MTSITPLSSSHNRVKISKGTDSFSLLILLTICTFLSCFAARRTDFVLILMLDSSFTLVSSLLLVVRSGQSPVGFTFWCARSFATKEGRNISAPSLLGAHLPDGRPGGGGGEGRGGGAGPTNQPTKRAPSAGGRAGCPPNNHRWTKRTKVSERGAQQLPDGTTRERTQQLVSEGRKTSKTDPRLCYENVDTMLI